MKAENVSKLYVGIDNGTSGAIGVVSDNSTLNFWWPTPIKNELSYTKTKQYISRVDFPKLMELFKDGILCWNVPVRVVMERPRVNPKQFKTTLSAMRSLEATLILIEDLKLPFSYVDSRDWQKDMLPSGIQDKELKKASKQIGKRLFPTTDFGKSDCDAILIAEWARRKTL
jgi:hypothetical protein